MEEIAIQIAALIPECQNQNSDRLLSPIVMRIREEWRRKYKEKCGENWKNREWGRIDRDRGQEREVLGGKIVLNSDIQ